MQDKQDRYSGARNNFTIIPNIVMHKKLSPYAFRLYAEIRMTTGDNGRCWKSAKTLADACNMSEGMVSKCKKELVDNKLITVTKRRLPNGGEYDDIVIPNLWAQNEDYFTADNDAQSHGDLPQSPHDPAQSYSDLPRSCSDPIKIPINKNQREEDEESPSPENSKEEDFIPFKQYDITPKQEQVMKAEELVFQVSGVALFNNLYDMPKIYSALADEIAKCGADEMRTRLTDSLADWVRHKNKAGKMYNKSNPGWIERAINRTYSTEEESQWV